MLPLHFNEAFIELCFPTSHNDDDYDDDDDDDDENASHMPLFHLIPPLQPLSLSLLI